jgi:hypothetical protein
MYVGVCVFICVLVFCVKAEAPEADIDTHDCVTFVCPYERYKRVKPFIQSQEAAVASTDNVAVVNGTRQDGDNERVQRVSPRTSPSNSYGMTHFILMSECEL